MDEKQQGNPGHDLKVPERVNLTAVDAGSEAAPTGISFVKPDPNYEASLVQDYRTRTQQAAQMPVGPMPASNPHIPLLEPKPAIMPAAPITAAEIKRGRGRPRKELQGGDRHLPNKSDTGSNLGADLAQGDGSADVAQQEEREICNPEVAGSIPAISSQPALHDSEVRAAAVALLRKMESLSHEWEQRIDALRIERRMRDDQIALMLIARSLDSPDYLETPSDHPYFSESFAPAGTAFHCVVCGKIQSMAYPGQRPLCVDGTNVCANRYNSLSPEDQQELLSDA